MAVRLRLKRMGRRHRPFYRIAAVDKRRARDSRILEDLGHFDPIEKDEAKQVILNEERAKYWLSVGAQPSERVYCILRKHGIVSGNYRGTVKPKAKPVEASGSE